jgi:DNA repair protein SbcC/Rad50
MRIHHLTIQGFGPFKDKQEIDFDALSQDKIFMLEGPTGAGKSSIIDAIVFSLYGVTAHEAATKSGPAGQRVRSDYCEAGDETKVCIEFSTGGARYKVTRTAAYEAPKKSGEGTTPVNAKAILEFIDPPHEAINQVKEVNLRIKEELRLDNEQFSQMVVLPQGDFASFLHASTEKRREVLESIFKTFFYDKIKSQLDVRAKEFQGLLAQQGQEINHHVRNLEKEWVESKGDLDFKRLESLLNDKNEARDTQNLELQAAIDLLRPNSEKQIQDRDAVEKVLNPLKADLALLEDSQEKIKAKTDLSKELDGLNARADEMALKESQLLVRQKASGLQTLLESRDSADDAMEEALEQIDENYAEMTSAEVKARIKELNVKVPALSKKADAAQKAETDLEDLEVLLEESIDNEIKIKALPGLVTKVSALEKKLEGGKKKVKEYRALEKDSYIGLAAKKLKKGQPCPVCGSAEHPNPVKGQSSFDQDELDRLEDIVAEVESELSELKYELKDATAASKKKFKPSTELKATKKKLEKSASDADEIQSEYEDAQQELSDLNDCLQHFIDYESAEKSKATSETKIESEMKRLKIEDEGTLIEILAIDEDALRAAVSAYTGRIKEINALLAQPDFKKLPESAELEEKIATLAEKVSVLDAELSLINDQLAVVERINESLRIAQTGITTAMDEIAELRETGDPYLKLQGWVDGTNPAGLSLTNFVLQERLEMILEYASRHLRRMSNGKYEFRLHEDRQGRAKKAGLGITIMDYFAGKERPAETLSGGETFYASLALALGLVEVVKGDNGGIELGTLFIDEGFGSLSDDTLEEVLDVLEDLREQRVIGIISHVEGMKTQIPMRLEVRPTEAGPSTVKMAIGKIA